MKPAILPQRKPWQSIGYAGLVLILLGIAIALMLINLEKQVIMSYDEARHGVNAYEMLRSGDFVVHTYQGEPDLWNLKPPLSFWMIALNFSLFGYNCVAFRLHSVIASCLMLLAVSLWMKKCHGKAASLMTLLFLVINPAMYELNFARTGEADALHILFVSLSMLCLFQSEKDVRWLYGSALGFGFSFLAKSFHAAIIPAMCFLYLISTGTLRKLKLKNYLLLLLLGLLPILPWAIARYARDGIGFFTEMLLTDVGARVSAETTGEQAAWYFYFMQLWQNPAVIGYGALCAAAWTWRRIQGNRLTHEQLGLLIWFALPIGLYSLSNSKLYHYIVPVMIPIAIAGSLSALAILRRLGNKGLRAFFCVLLALGAAWLTYGNAESVLSRGDRGSMQETLDDMLDRDLDSGMHLYVLYVDGNTVWRQNDMLRALLSGDVVCLDGGAEAFEEDGEDALLVIDKEIMPYDLLEWYPIYYESANQYVLEN